MNLINRYKYMYELLKEFLDAYDAFMFSDMDTHVSNPAWARMCNVAHCTRIFLHEGK